jgi:hypothetical protein
MVDWPVANSVASLVRFILIVLVTITSLGTPRASEAQVLGYGVGGLGARAGWFGGGAALQASGGGEVLVSGLAGGAGEYGLFVSSGSALQVASFNGVVHLASIDNPTSPFVTAGYSRFWSGEGEFDAWNVGVGADFRLNPHTAIRADFRDHVRSDFRGTVHYLAFRLGIAFR